MNPAYAEFLRLPEGERSAVFEETAANLDTIVTYVEKDFWVCLVLDLLYHDLPKDHPSLFFKGGTSLSKVFGLIRRFSEDIDITVNRESLGFDGIRDPLRQDLSGKARGRLVKALEEEARCYVTDRLEPVLANGFSLLDERIRIEPDLSNAKNPALVVSYPEIIPDGLSYVTPRVKIELGALSAQEPSTLQSIAPYIDNRVTQLDFKVDGIDTIAAERTFWDKVFMLHGLRCGFEDAGRGLADRNRLSRHYYDVAIIFGTPVSEGALSDESLREKVREYRKVMFASKWEKLDVAVPGGFRIAPKDGLRDAIARDYEAMQGMMLGDGPTFDEVAERLRKLEDRLNSGA